MCSPPRPILLHPAHIHKCSLYMAPATALWGFVPFILHVIQTDWFIAVVGLVATWLGPQSILTCCPALVKINIRKLIYQRKRIYEKLMATWSLLCECNCTVPKPLPPSNWTPPNPPPPPPADLHPWPCGTQDGLNLAGHKLVFLTARPSACQSCRQYSQHHYITEMTVMFLKNPFRGVQKLSGI